MEKGVIIEFDHQEYLVFESVVWNEHSYYVLVPVRDDKTVEEEAFIVREENGEIFSLENEEEMKAVRNILENLDKEA